MLRLRRLTAAVVAGAGVLALGFALVAAKAFPGRSSNASVGTVTQVTTTTTRTTHAAQSAPPLVQIGSQSQPTAPASPAPTPTPAAPVVVSGGS